MSEKRTGGAGRPSRGTAKTGSAAKGGARGRRNRAGVRKLERKERGISKITLKEKENVTSFEEERLTKEENIAVGICPFYQQDRGNGRVNCEGASLKFPDKEARREFVYRLCAHPDGYKECRLRVALEHYYERKYANHE